MIAVTFRIAQLLQMKGKAKQENVEILDNTLNMIYNLCKRYEQEEQANIWNTNSHNDIGEPSILLIIFFILFLFFFASNCK